MKIKKINLEKVIFWFVFITLILSVAYTIVMIILSPTKILTFAPEIRSKSDYILMLLQCVIGVFALLLPGIIEHKFNLIIPSKMILLFTIFLYAAIYLGEVRNFYYNIKYWDTILHTFSGVMLGALGYSIIVLLNKTDKVPLNLSPIFIALFTFCFAVTLGVFWEFYEYIFDGILGLNMQKYALENGKPLIGHDALGDTMKDLIVDAVGALCVSIAGFISMKYKKGWIERVLLKIY